MAFELRPLSLGEILDRTFRLYRDNFAVFFGVSAVAQIPNVFAAVIFGSPEFNPRRPPSEAIAQLAGPSVLGILGNFVAQGGLATAIGARALDRTTSVADAYAGLRRWLTPLVAAWLLYAVLVMLGIVLLIIPGMYLGAALSFAFVVIVVERLGPVAALGRSRRLARGDVNRIFSAYMILGFFALLVWVLLSFLLGRALPASVARATAEILGGTLASPLYAGATVLLYFDNRVRKEGFDLAMMASALGAPAPSRQ